MTIPRLHTSLRIGAGKSLALLLCWWILLFAVALVIIGFISGPSGTTVASMRWAITVQDILVFIAPTIFTALIAAYHPWSYIGVDTLPDWKAVAGVVVVAFVSIPTLNCIVAWNDSLHLPESMADIETLLRNAEEMARASVAALMSGTSVETLLMGVLLVGILTGIAEEFFFRGGLQRIFGSLLRRPVLAVWCAAIVFSAIHMQFFGFFPRVLMGAWFGYLFLWSRSLWLPILGHALNNSLVVLSTWMTARGYIARNTLDTIGTSGDGISIALAAGSILLTAATVYAVYRFTHK